MIYLLEDDEAIRELVTYSLTKTVESTLGFCLPSEFYRAMASELPRLVLLDCMLPEEDGLAVLAKLRADDRTRDIPVIMLTAKGSEFDKVTAFDLGADDYIVKPFGVMELVARVKALIRRAELRTSERAESDQVYTVGALTLSVSRREVYVSGEAVSLTYKEFELLLYLFKNRGIVLGRDKILENVWGYDFDGESRTVDVHIRTLRQKLGCAGDVIETVRGVGYKIARRKE